MDNDRPSLDVKHFADICPDKNGMSKLSRRFMNELTYAIFQVPVIAIFTKFDQFKRDIKMRLEDEGRYSGTHFDTEMESVFIQYYLASLSGSPPFVRLESEDFFDQFTCILISIL